MQCFLEILRPQFHYIMAFSWIFIFLLEILALSPGSLCQDTSINPGLKKCLYNKLGSKMTTLNLPSTVMGNNENASFPLQVKCPTREPHCLQVCPTEVLRPRIPFPPPNSESSLPLSAQFTPSGFLRYGSDFFPPDEYCIFDASKTSVTLEICRPSCGKSHVCVPKCCSADKVLDISTLSCQYATEAIWQPLVYQTEDLQVCGASRAQVRFHYYAARLGCQTQAYFLKAVSGDLEKFRVKFRLLLNGSVVVRELLGREWKRPEDGEYCLDGVQFGDKPYTGDPLDQVLLICVDEEDEESQRNETSAAGNGRRVAITGILYSILLFSGTPFLLVTVAVYVLLWGKQNVHGWSLFSHTLAMLLNSLGQGCSNAASRLYDSDDNASTSCMLIGIANHYFALASFTWMTMINYDLWSMFRYLQNTVGRSRGRRRFIAYSCIGWGVPLLAVLICVVLDLKYGLYGDDGGECTTEIVVPLYGHKSCYIFEESRPYFLFYPIGTLMGINLVFAGMTARNMYSHRQSAKIAEKKSTKHKRMFSVWYKLFVVMGIALTSEVVVWNLKKKDETLPWYLIFPDVITVLQAIAIFVLFACQPKIIRQLYEGYPRLRPFLDKVLQLRCYSKTETKTPPHRFDGVPAPVKL